MSSNALSQSITNPVLGKNDVWMTCGQCQKLFRKPKKEVTRQRKSGRNVFFCGLSCSAVHRNKSKKALVIQKSCPVCSASFTSTTKVKGATFCSRVCASKGSVTELRRNKASISGSLTSLSNFTIESFSKGMKRREDWKYEQIKSFLIKNSIDYEFECVVDGFVFDLALIGYRTLIEFDGPEHRSDRCTIKRDAVKALAASSDGWNVIRVSVKPSTVFPVKDVEDILKKLA